MKHSTVFFPSVICDTTFSTECDTGCEPTEGHMKRGITVQLDSTVEEHMLMANTLMWHKNLHLTNG